MTDEDVTYPGNTVKGKNFKDAQSLPFPKPLSLDKGSE